MPGEYPTEALDADGMPPGMALRKGPADPKPEKKPAKKTSAKKG